MPSCPLAPCPTPPTSLHLYLPLILSSPCSAVAGEAGATFIALNASEFVEMFVGVGASRVRDLFAQASTSRLCVPSALGPRRAPHLPCHGRTQTQPSAEHLPLLIFSILYRRPAPRPPQSSSSMRSTLWAASGGWKRSGAWVWAVGVGVGVGVGVR